MNVLRIVKSVSGKRLMSLLLTVALIATCLLPSAAWAKKEAPLKNIIYFIGDGMGAGIIALTRYYSVDILGKELTMTRVMNLGSTAYQNNNAFDFITTDSAAAGTALATGYKTTNIMIGMTPDGIPRETILEKAKRLGKSVGVVSTTRLTHATPASFVAHVDFRDKEVDIANQMIASGTDVMMAGGWSFFVPKADKDSKRKDDRDLMAEAAQMGYTVVKDAAAFRALDVAQTTKVLGLFNKSHMNYEIDRDDAKEPSLAELTQTAINLLSKNDKGFFLMVEGGRIDHAEHVNDAATAVKDTLAFDKAIEVAMAYSEEDPETLIVVTADHDTAGPTLTQGRPTPADDLEYLSVPDLKLLGKATGSFEVKIIPEVKKAKDAAEVKAIVEKVTSIPITDEEAKEIADLTTPITPALSIEVFMLTDASFAKLKEANVPADIIAKLETMKGKEYEERGGFRLALWDVLDEAQSKQYDAILMKVVEKKLVKAAGVSIGRAVADEVSVAWASRHHTAATLLLFAVGPYSEYFNGFLENTDIPKIMADAIRAGY